MESSVKYTRGAHPTIYNNRQYRSRLEAKWAAFFDLLGWRHEYEPLDLGEWSPDFVLYNYQGDVAALVEIKPVSSLADDVCQKMEIGVSGTELDGKELLLLGLSPAITDDDVLPFYGPSLGWLAEYGYQIPGDDQSKPYWWQRAGLGLNESGQIDYAHEYGRYSGRIFHGGYKDHYPVGISHIRAMWSEAANKTQWRKPAR